MKKAIVLALCLTPSAAYPHSEWLDGRSIDPKTRQLCCGENDCKIVSPTAVHLGADGRYRFDDTRMAIDQRRAQPSPDGAYWRCIWNGEIKCFFAPLNGT